MLNFEILQDSKQFYTKVFNFSYKRAYTYLTYNAKWLNGNLTNKFENKKIDGFLKKLKIKVNFGALECAYYDQEGDKIIMPYKRYFRKIKKVSKEQNYYHTLFHEVIHWSGSDKRLNRKCLFNFDARPDLENLEEMIAEIGSNYLIKYFEISDQIPEASLIYIKRHFNSIPEEKQERLFKLAHKKAAQAAKYLIKKYESKL